LSLKYYLKLLRKSLIMKPDVLLGIGVAAVSLSLGYMVGGSSTPIVGIALPLLFGLLTVAIDALIQQRTLQKLKAKVDEIAATPNGEGAHAVNRLEAKISEDQSKHLGGLGILLLVFAMFYTGGTVVGSLARTHTWFAPRKVLPWIADTAPGSSADAVAWLDLSDNLRHRGWTTTQIAELYRIHLSSPAAIPKAGEANINGPKTIPVVAPESEDNTTQRRPISSAPDSRVPQSIFPMPTIPGLNPSPFRIVTESEVRESLDAIRRSGMLRDPSPRLDPLIIIPYDTSRPLQLQEPEPISDLLSEEQKAGLTGEQQQLLQQLEGAQSQRYLRQRTPSQNQ